MTTAPPPPWATRWTARTAMLASALLALIVSLPSLGHDFVYDDVWVISEREVVHEGSPLTLATERYWPEDRGGALWRPGALLAFSAQWRLGGGSPAVFHGTNVALYAAVAALLALLASRLFNPAAGLIGGVLFAVHPVHVEATANVVGQAELIPALCYLAVLLLAWRSLGATGRPRLPILAAISVLTLVGAAVKEHVVTLPGAVLVLWWLESTRSPHSLRDLARRQWPILVAILVPLGIYLVGRGLMIGGVSDAGGVAPGLSPDSIFQRLTVMLPVSLHWVRLLFWPVELSADYGPAHLVPRTEFGILHGLVLTAWLVLFATVWNLRMRLPEVAVGLGLFLVTISVVSNVVVPLEILLAERLLLLPSAGWAIAVGGLAVHTANRWPKARMPVLASLALLTLLFAWHSLERLPTWSENDRFFEQMADDAPRSYRVSLFAAEVALEEGDTVRADRLLLETAARNPFDPRTPERLGLLRLQRGEPEAAIPPFIDALERGHGRQPSLLGLSIALTRTGRGEEALPWLDWLEELHGPSVEALLVRVDALRAAGRFRESIALAEAGLAERPRNWSLHLLATRSGVAGGLCEVAIRHAEEGRAKAPEERRGDFDRALEPVTSGEVVCQVP